MVMYGGDEVSAIVLDIGTHTTRAGYAGEEVPRAVIPTSYGWKDVEVEVDDEETTTENVDKNQPVTHNGAAGTSSENGSGLAGDQPTENTQKEEDTEMKDGSTEQTAADESKPEEGNPDVSHDKPDQPNENGPSAMEGVEDNTNSADATDAPTAGAPPISEATDSRVPPRAGSTGPSATAEQTRKDRPKKKITERRYYMGENGVNVWRQGMEVDNMMRDGIVADPKPLPHLISHIYHDRLAVDSSEHALLVTEPAWNTTRAREIMAEIAFEGENVPAFYIACSAVLSAFSAGKGTALIVDIGSDLVSVVPVSDGYALRAGTKRQPLAISLLNSQIRHYLTTRDPVIDLTPHQLIKSRTPVDTGKPPQYNLNSLRRDGTTPSWREFAESKIVEGWREACAEVSSPLAYAANLEHLSARPNRLYEFPTGYSQNFDIDRYKLPEMFFNPREFINRSAPVPPQLLATPDSPSSYSINSLQHFTQLISESVLACDVDQRGPLLQNIVVVGGGALTPGLTDRLNVELSARWPGQKVRIHSPGNSVERKYSAWLGGSILASLGTFQQLWVARSEWEEYGPAILRQSESLQSAFQLDSSMLTPRGWCDTVTSYQDASKKD